MTTSRPTRKKLPHEVPSWVKQGARYFITVNGLHRNRNILAHPKPGFPLLASAVHYHNLGHWYLWLAMVMPDHMHLIATLNLDLGLKKTISAWKGFQKRTLGIEWQDGFFDHRLRNEDSFAEKMMYVRMNPVRKGLAEKPEDWRYCVDFRMIEEGWSGPG